jgi:hypothetical protein
MNLECRCPSPEQTVRIIREITANILGSYLRVSFDLENAPPERRIPDPQCGLGCPWCFHVVRGPHLKPKKVTPRDRRQADAFVRATLGRLAEHVGLAWDSPSVAKVSMAFGPAGWDRRL